jgi:hypothetical protein
MATSDVIRDSHPSPHRAKTGLAPLLYGLTAAPLAWVASQFANAALAQEACFPGTEPLVAPAFAGVHVFHAAVLFAALLVSLSAALIAFRAWRLSGGERAGGAGALLDVGEGRTRFMAFAGLLTSLGFAVATLFSLPALFLVPAC